MTETLDKVYLEYSRITKARTYRERVLAARIRWLLDYGGAMRQRLADNDGPSKRWESQVEITTKLLVELDV